MTNSIGFYRSIDTETAYVAKRAKDFNLLVATQAESLYRERGMVFPVRVSSTLDYIAREAPVSQADVSRALDQPHQLVAHRIAELQKLGLIQRSQDPNDRRRTLIDLTPKGRSQVQILWSFTNEAVEVFSTLFEEIGLNLSEGLGKAIAALKSHPLDQRFDAYSEAQEAS